MNKRWHPEFRSTFQGREYSIWATNHWKVNRKFGLYLLFLLPKSSFGEHKLQSQDDDGMPMCQSESTSESTHSCWWHADVSIQLSVELTRWCGHTTMVKDKCIYEKCTQPTHWGGLGGTRCLDSYLVSKKCAVKLCEYIERNSYIRLSTDLWMNTMMRQCNLKVYWAEPTIVTQGSESGKYKSTTGPQFVPKFWAYLRWAISLSTIHR
jgi:hypothetical protein